MSELIYSFKEIHKQNEISEDILNKFSSINKIILSSTQFQDTKKIIKYCIFSKMENRKM